jgi:hypothetical protein
MSIPITVPNKAPAVRVGTALTASKLDIQVLSPAGVFVRVGHSRDELDNPLPFSGPAGLQLDSTVGILEVQWQGEIWMEGLPANASTPVVTVNVTPN